MIVSPDLMMNLTRALGAPLDLKAEGIVRMAVERLAGPREYHLEVLGLDGKWDFHSFHETAGEAQLLRAKLRKNFNAEYRIVELLRRVLP